MAYINNILIVGLLMLCSCKNQAQPYQLSKEPYNIVYGQWKHVYHEWHQYGKLNTVQVDSLKHVLFKIGKDKAYFENISFIDTCSFSTSDIKISKLFDKANKWEYSWYEDGEQFLLRPKDVGPLIYRYTKEELSEINKIELGCEYGVGILYLKQDTLILNYIGGVTLFMTKQPYAFESYTGTGSITKELKLTGKETTLKLSYEFYKEADELIVYDQNGKELDRTGMQATTKEVTETINIYDVTKLVFKIESKEANSKWKFSVMVE
jgi:hypothetical protein